MKTEEREWARDLRRHRAMSVKEIARLVGVAPSSVSVWVRDVPLTPEQLESLRLRNPAYNAQLRGANRNAELWRARRAVYQDEGREMAKHGSWLVVAGVMLYWAEGDKKHCNAARISNSDPEVLKLFMRFLRECLEVPDERIRATCNLFADHLARQEQIEQFWLNTLDLPFAKYERCLQGRREPFGRCNRRDRPRLVDQLDDGIEPRVSPLPEVHGRLDRRAEVRDLWRTLAIRPARSMSSATVA